MNTPKPNIIDNLKDSTPVRVLLKCNSFKLGCRLVVGITDEIESMESLISIAVTSYPTGSEDEEEGKLLDSFVIELKAQKLVDMMKADTFVYYIEGAYMAMEEYKYKRDSLCPH